jgi:hypothetical protein
VRRSLDAPGGKKKMEQVQIEELAFFAVIAMAAASIPLFLATTIGFKMRGPVRWVKICAAVLVADFVTLLCVYSGWESGVRFIGLTGVSIFAAVSLAFLSWRHPISKVLSPANERDCPKHARAALERWTRELEALGFQIESEQRTTWQIQGSDRTTFIRFLTHHADPLWVEIHALDDPKVAARMAVSDKADGRSVITVDRQSDQELFDDPLTAIQRVASGADCRDLIDAHRKLAMTTEGSLSRVDDPAQAHVELYGGWVQRLLHSRQVRQVDERRIGLRPLSIPGLILKTWAAFFH